MISMCPLQILKYWMMEIALEPRSSQRNMCAQIQAAIFGGVCFKLKDTKKSERTCLYHLVSMFEVNNFESMVLVISTFLLQQLPQIPQPISSHLHDPHTMKLLHVISNSFKSISKFQIHSAHHTIFYFISHIFQRINEIIHIIHIINTYYLSKGTQRYHMYDM